MLAQSQMDRYRGEEFHLERIAGLQAERVTQGQAAGAQRRVWELLHRRCGWGQTDWKAKEIACT